MNEGLTADDLPDGYYLATVDGKEKVCEKINDKDIPIRAIFRIQIDAFEFKGYDKAQNGRALFYCYYGNVYNNAEVTKIVNGWCEQFGITYDMSNPNAGSWVSTAFTVLSLVVVCVVFFLIIRSSMGGGNKIMSFAKTKARVTTNIKVRFSDVAGAEEEKVELAEVVEFLRQPKKFSDLGARIPKGVL